MKKKRIYLSPPHVGEEEQRYIREAFESNWVAPAGPHLEALEEEFCALTGARHAVAMSSGTAALHLALLLAGVETGDEVICSTLSFVASANPIVYRGARPVFVDSDFVSWNLDPVLLCETMERRAAENRLPKAVVVVHLYGQCADMDPILEVCRKYEVTVIEDAAEAVGATYRGRHAGVMGRMGIYSFNGNKIVTTSGGGMFVSDNKALCERARHLATQARDPAPHYQHSEVGYNYRMSNVLAGIGRGQLEKLERYVEARRANFSFYYDRLEDLPGVNFMPEADYGKSTRWLTCLTVDQGVDGVAPETIRVRLEADNIESRPVWKPLHMQPVFAGCEVIGGGVAESLFETGLCLPSGSALTDEDRERVVKAVRSCFEQ